MTNAKAPVTRAPRGVLSGKPVCIRLMPEELQQLETLAREENRSVSSLGRLLLLAGMVSHQNKRSPRAL